MNDSAATRTREEVLASLNWSEPREVQTKRGPKLVRSAKPTAEVNELRRTDPDFFYKAGYSFTVFRGNEQITEWRDLPKEKIEAIAKTKELSRADDADVFIPISEGNNYLPFQRAGVAFMARMFGIELQSTSRNRSREDANGSLLSVSRVENGDSCEPGSRACARGETQGQRRDSDKREDERVSGQSKGGGTTSISGPGSSQEARRGGEEGAGGEGTVLQGRKRSRADRSGDASGGASSSDGICPAISGADKEPRDESQCADVLQTGSSEPENKDRDRAGRPESSQLAGTSKRDQEGGGPSGARMDHSAAPARGVLLADAPGLGKTLQSIAIINLSPEATRIVIICPASLKLNWRNELLRFSTKEREIYVMDGQRRFPKGEAIIILNWDILYKFRNELRAEEFDILIADEAHFAKNAQSRRAKMLFGSKKPNKTSAEGLPPVRAKRKLLLTGTPIVNRPAELFPLINFLDPARWTSFWGYAKRYCAAYKSRFGWDTSGASNLDELQDALRSSIMVRRLKKDVLTELPPKRRAVIELPAEGDLARFAEDEREAYEEREDVIAGLNADVELAKASDDPTAYVVAVDKLRKGMTAILAEMSKMRAELAAAKVPLCIEHLKEVLEETPKVVVFVHHKIVAAKLKAEFGDEAVVLVGDTAMIDRQAAVDRFQNDPTCKLFIGSIGAAGVGITLTAASHVVFCELSWVPGEVTQGEDRCHRIGQRGSVLVQHLVVEGSLDATIAKRIVAKQSVIDAALDSVRAKVEGEPLNFSDKKGRGGATVDTPADKLAKEALEMTEDQRKASHEALRFIASRCNGAKDWDGVGFSKMDTNIGIDLAGRTWLSPKQAALARKVARKYRNTQLPEAIVARMGGAA